MNTPWIYHFRSNFFLRFFSVFRAAFSIEASSVFSSLRWSSSALVVVAVGSISVSEVTCAFRAFAIFAAFLSFRRRRRSSSASSETLAVTFSASFEVSMCGCMLVEAFLQKIELRRTRHLLKLLKKLRACDGNSLSLRYAFRVQSNHC